MPQIKYIEGDLFAAIKDSDVNVVVPHVCNNVGAFGAGFVLPLSKAYPKAKSEYQNWFNGNVLCQDTLTIGDFGLGSSQFVFVEENVFICNMIAQTLSHQRPISYKYLVLCMIDVRQFAITLSNARIVCPMFGAGLAQGNWNFIEQLIQDCWSDFEVHVHYLPQYLPDNWDLPNNNILNYELRP